MKKFTLISSLLLMLFILAGCGNNNSNNSAKSNNSGEKTFKNSSYSLDKEPKEEVNYINQDGSKINKNEFNSGITYDNIARTPDKFSGKKVSFQGTVIQTIYSEEKNLTQMRLAVNGNYNKIVQVTINNKNLHESRILEGDLIKIYGRFHTIMKYKSTSGIPVTIPSIESLNIEDKGEDPNY